ncbi:hypothetical protein KOR34_25040 [Posidoniimonas corsicana]|uniref:Uncharacterized protein n=1 Tax=Posidoniimonas corsicana TaxID=1938618 RepID=A0A5C5VHG4_9BACT|nr:hypothetical protein [Posidoniimonas corsicana]TWT37551.1 hypothetical protein KOR34_25040 [Posidoniimonas corsicana]
MPTAFLFAALAATAVTYEWRPVDDAQGGHEYVVTVEQELLQAAEEGGPSTFRSDVPQDVKRIRSVVVKLGDGPQRHGVLKPPVDAEAIDDEQFAPIRHTVYQQTYPPQGYPPQGYPPVPTAMEQGFSEYNTPAAEPRKSIGSQLAKGTEKVIDGTGRVIKDTGEAIEGTALNIRDGFRHMVNPTATTTTTTAAVATPQAPGAYQPYAYNQQTPTAAYPPIPSLTPTAASPQGYPGSSGPPVLTTPTGAQSPPPGQSPPPLPPSGLPSASGGNPSVDPSQYSGQTAPRGGQAFVSFSEQEEETFAPIRDSRSDNSNSYRTNQVQSHQPPAQGQYAPNNQYPPGGQQSQPPAANDDPWPPWPDSNQSAPPYNHGQYAGGANGGYPPRPTTASYGPSAGGQAPDPASWNPNSIDGQASVGGQQNDQQSAGADPPPSSGKSSWYAVVAVAAIGSIAWNFYLGMNYIDARNKYRAALRRSGRAYSEVIDDM